MPTSSAVYSALEGAYYLSGVAIAIFAGIGLHQLRLTKESLVQNSQLARTAAKRESYRLAAEYCRAFEKDLMPRISACRERAEKCGFLKHLRSFKIDVSKTGISVTPPTSFQGIDPDDQQTEVLSSIVSISNALDAFSIVFTSGVAAEAVAFPSVAPPFCSAVEDYLPILLTPAVSNHFDSLLTLFHVWHTRLRQEELRRKKDEISKQLDEAHEIQIDPIGT